MASKTKKAEYMRVYHKTRKAEFIAETGIKNDHLDLVTPVKHRDKKYAGYAIDRITGQIYKTGGDYNRKKQYGWYPMSVSLRSGYPMIGLRPSLQKLGGSGGKKDTVSVHICVMHTINGPPPRPADVKKKDWQVLPSYIKEFLLERWVVNHIDHDKTNFAPSNLEYTTPKGNSEKYQAHRAKNGKVA